MTIHQCSPPIWVITPLGEGHCLFIFDYGVQLNSVWGVHLLGSGKFKHFDSDDILILGNPMYGSEVTPGKMLDNSSEHD